MPSLAQTGADLLNGILADSRPLGGGDISSIQRILLRDGRTALVKDGPAPDTEARMLTALRKAGAPTPEILAADHRALVMEERPATGTLSRAWASLGQTLHTLHTTPIDPAYPKNHYGWPDPFAFGTLKIDNTWRENWANFWADNRLLTHVPHVPPDLGRRLARLARTVPDRLPATPRPSLLHGDLWSGNILSDQTGTITALIDPACCIGPAEADFAMLTLFARPTQAFQGAYGPLEPGHQDRIALYRLWPALVHLRLFGGTYHAMVTHILDDLSA